MAKNKKPVPAPPNPVKKDTKLNGVTAKVNEDVSKEYRPPNNRAITPETIKN